MPRKIDVPEIVKEILKKTEKAGFTQQQLCDEAGLKYNNLSKLKNPTLKTIMKLIEAKNRLIQKRK